MSGQIHRNTHWPDHCLQQTPGAQLHPGLDVPQAECILRKGFRPHIDSYSAFLENDHTTPTGLAGYLRERNLSRLFLCGLAYDFCVLYSAIDGEPLGFETIVIEDACRPVNLPGPAGLSGSVEAANTSLAAANIPRIQSTDVLTR
jgi:nicotinamidase/pyrazinamidase